jgi:nitrogen fixation/metabolism regulation signal transduction histidine kinase
LKAVDLLTINSDKLVLQKQVLEAKEKSKDSEYIIKAKLQEKDEQINLMKEQFNSMQSQIQELVSTIGSIDESNKKETAKQLIEKGVYQ